jgi:LmbE family N-acetylglucosaminyl deacetylase
MVPRWDPPPTPTLVVAPHPDDEVLACGGLIGRQRDRGVDVRVLAVTDGERAYEADSLELDLAGLRRMEQRDALHVLGVDGCCVWRARLPDGDVARHERELVGRIIDCAKGFGLIVAPWVEDHHCDHEASGRAAAAAARTLGIPLVHSLFWAWHHGTPAALPTERMVSVPLRRSEVRRRHDALDRHRSQLTDLVSAVPMLSYDSIEPVRWDSEYYLVGQR